ncbi:UDP-4-amino-4,6-dideoxy-N-acetyl-beta-L-altrosamine transaminase [Sediminicoccus rosea]|uniref:UDP-4-amino-4, 6-dideoxy-N-acetyl-beta-L-altrosamine transaminase n=1 Tax=Sediminicoccus rosea TaxID=1225128 RepID=A0ABZ0PNZ5_9PROT|nr:UDP-4-amino-4,6-dideoxy-N-acetyl-beta-L-altrosamine transaminase [Sediminicoccus rosea]WPB87451.1 UDP-4-amino-4,6-dideoxy-N-acetyl-beta-L-altrosamine transaminase [Sediminicoccus rosea]
MSHPDAPFLPYGRQNISAEDVSAVVEVLQGDWLTQGPSVSAFEAALATRTGAAHVIACSNATTGLHLAALALDLGPGQAAIVPSVTFLSTANAVRMTGAEVVFCDVDPDTGLARAQDIEQAFRAGSSAGLDVRAAFPVHLAGQPTEAGDAARALGLKVVEDAAHAIGTMRQRGNDLVPIGCTESDGMAVFSFHPVKTLATGEGGAVSTNDPHIAARLRSLRSHGMTREPSGFRLRERAFDNDTPNPWYYEMHELGFNYRITDMQCALGLSQMARLDSFIASRQAAVARYDTGLAPLAPLVKPFGRSPSGRSVSWHLYVALIDFESLGVSRAKVMAELRAAGIGTQVHYIPVHTQPYYVGRYGAQHLPGAEEYYKRCLSLPLYHGLTEADTDRVVQALTDIVQRAGG